jgi:acyl-CoA dehydrogenase
VVEAEAAERKLERAVRAGTVRRFHGIDWIEEAFQEGVVDAAEADLLREAEALRSRAIAVDDFDPAEVEPHYVDLGHNSRAAQRMAAAE